MVNIERFSAPKSMRGRTLKEGLVDLEERKAEEALELDQRAEEILDGFYAGDFQLDTGLPDTCLSKELSKYPKKIQVVIFRRWLKRDPEKALQQIEAFGSLPQSCQKDIAVHLLATRKDESLRYYSYSDIIKSFDKITDERLSALIAFSAQSTFLFLAENREKFPYLSDEQILKRTHYGNGVCNWSSIVEYIDKFPSVDKRRAVEGALEQTVNSRPWVIMEKKEALQISEQELIEAFYRHNKAHELCMCLNNIDPKYHQEIADKSVAEHFPQAVLTNAEYFRSINIPEVITAIGEACSDIADVIVEVAYALPASWVAQLPQEWINEACRKHPQEILVEFDPLRNRCPVADFKDRINWQILGGALLARRNFNSLIYAAEIFERSLDANFAWLIVNNGGARAVIDSLRHFLRLPRELYLRLLEETNEVTPHVLSFDGITKDDVIKALKDQLYGRDIVNGLIKNPLQMEEFFGEPGRADVASINLAHELVDIGRTTDVLDCIEELGGIDKIWLANTVIEKGFGDALIDRYEFFQGSVDDKDIIKKLIAKGEQTACRIIERIDCFSGIAGDRALALQMWSTALRFSWDTTAMIRFNEMFSPHIDATFTQAADIFGDWLTPDTYNTVVAIRDGRLPKEESSALGIYKSGEVGINQLRKRITDFKSTIPHEDFDIPTFLAGHDIYRQFYRRYVRYEGSAWGAVDDASFRRTVEEHLQLQQAGLLKKISEKYVASGEVRVARVDQKKQEAFQYSEQFLIRFKTLQDSMAKALELSKQPRPLSHLVETIEKKRANIARSLKERAEHETSAPALDGIRRRMAMLEGLDLRRIKGFQDNFEKLAGFKELHEELRQLIFCYALHKNRSYRRAAEEMVAQERPRFKDIQWTIDFIEHIVNEETWRGYFANHRAEKVFRGLINVNALHEEFARAQDQGKSGTSTLEFIPTRGLLMEFSGHIADACWASKYDSISREFPNFSTVIFVQNRGTKNERLVGACMLIETTAHDGTPLLVIRGLNPIENVINALNVEDFYQKVTDYLKKLAEATGRELAIVIDDHSGGSATNRPSLFIKLCEKKKTLQRIKLASSGDTTFNNYNIVNCTYKVT